MNVGDVSKPLPYVTKDQKQAYRIFYLKNRISPHKANLKDDYQKMQQMAQMRKQNKNIQDWMSKKIKSTYIRVDSFIIYASLLTIGYRPIINNYF